MEYYKIVNNNICINNKEANQLNKQILVIGNGFDLSCGLDSRYSDFLSIDLSNFLANKRAMSGYDSGLIRSPEEMLGVTKE